jgi:hypothetical protein
MTAVCCALAEAAIARGKSFAGTIPGSSAWMVGISKARAVPEASKIASMASRVSALRAVPTASASAAAALHSCEIAMTSRRSNTSATWPMTIENPTNGRNCMSPTRPRSNGSLVSS